MLLHLLLLLLPTTASSSLPEGYFINWNQGSYTYSPDVPIVRSYADALPEAIIPYLLNEAEKAHAWEKRVRDPNLKHSKAATNWVDMANILKPRTASEMAVNFLLKLAFPDGTLPKGGIAGGEWWIQSRNTNENIGFHVDKDEGVASEEQWMKMPALSTVTYLTDEGGPTLVLNQSSNRGGNQQTPELPTQGILVFPKKNRHILFRGNLQHGVVGEFGEKGVNIKRVTFLVNWWDKKPMSPYCMSIDDATAENDIRSDLLQSSSWESLTSSLLGGANKVDALFSQLQDAADQVTHDTTETFNRIEIPEDGSSKRKRFDIRVPPTKRYNFPVPHDIATNYQQQIVEFDWDPQDVNGILRNLDFNSHMCMHLFHNRVGLKIVIFRDNKNKKNAMEFDLDVAYQVAKPYVDLEESTGTVIYSADAGSRNRNMLQLAKNSFGIRTSKRNKNIFPAVGAMLVTGKKKKRFFQMPDTLPMEPEVILNWIGQIETKQKVVLDHEIVNGRFKKKKTGSGSKKKKKKRKEEL